ncbi:MAG: hypothetical protein OXE50_12485 [Chloroflexi bacterium]|nr:hypothetical protein [Chloroflexota bacterium]
MREDVRRAVAFAAAGRANGQFSTSVYSYERRKYSSMSQTYDYEARCHLSGMRSGSIFHYGVRAHIAIKLNGRKFSGFDYHSRSHFSGKVSGNSVQLYDYGERRYFNFSV